MLYHSLLNFFNDILLSEPNNTKFFHSSETKFMAEIQWQSTSNLLKSKKTLQNLKN